MEMCTHDTALNPLFGMLKYYFVINIHHFSLGDSPERRGPFFGTIIFGKGPSSFSLCYVMNGQHPARSMRHSLVRGPPTPLPMDKGSRNVMVTIVVVREQWSRVHVEEDFRYVFVSGWNIPTFVPYIKWTLLQLTDERCPSCFVCCR